LSEKSSKHPHVGKDPLHVVMYSATVIALDAVRIDGGYGCSTECDVERYFRDAPQRTR
jgi:hypothetical protein